jgi:Flp pilus assembly protein TadD
MSRRRRPIRSHEAHDRRRPAAITAPDPVEALVGRSRRHARKGETHRAIVLLRQACALDERRARSFTLLGALLLRSGRGAEAEAALRHARWLRARAGEAGRAAATQRLLDRAMATAA